MSILAALDNGNNTFDFGETTSLGLWKDGAEGLVDNLAKVLMTDDDGVRAMQRWGDYVRKSGKSELGCLVDEFVVRYRTKFEGEQSLMAMNLFKVFVSLADQAAERA